VSAFEPLNRTPGVVFGDCGGIWIMTVIAEPTLVDMQGARPALGAMARRYPKGFPTLTWVLPQAGYRMESSARDEASSVTKSFSSSILAQATLIEGSGFQAATVRAIVSGLDLMTRSSCPKKTFSEVAPAVAWCLSHAAEGRGAQRDTTLAAALLAMRATEARASDRPAP
jgi:hypothetical protein